MTDKNGQIVMWPTIGIEVENIFEGKIGTVLETKKEGIIEMALVDWGLHENWIEVGNLKELDT